MFLLKSLLRIFVSLLRKLLQTVILVIINNIYRKCQQVLDKQYKNIQNDSQKYQWEREKIRCFLRAYYVISVLPYILVTHYCSELLLLLLFCLCHHLLLPLPLLPSSSSISFFSFASFTSPFLPLQYHHEQLTYLSTYYMQGTVLHALHELPFNTTNNRVNSLIISIFTNKSTKAQKSQVNSLSSHSLEMTTKIETSQSGSTDLLYFPAQNGNRC